MTDHAALITKLRWLHGVWSALMEQHPSWRDANLLAALLSAADALEAERDHYGKLLAEALAAKEEAERLLADRDALDRIAYNAAISTTDDLIACRAKLNEALAAKERAEAERDDWKKHYRESEEEVRALNEENKALDAERCEAFAAKERAEEWSRKRAEDIMTLGQEVGRLTAALAAAREALPPHVMASKAIAIINRALVALPTTEPATVERLEECVSRCEALRAKNCP